jgi:hypothetical protein
MIVNGKIDGGIVVGSEAFKNLKNRVGISRRKKVVEPFQQFIDEFEDLNKMQNKYVYKHYKKDNDNLIFVEKLSRDDFEKQRQENGSLRSMEHGGNHCLRFNSATDDVYEEIRLYESCNKTYEIFNKFLDSFIKENEITKVEVFKDFLREFIVPFKTFNDSYTSHSIREVLSIEKDYIELFK